jgi:hypothetical protein
MKICTVCKEEKDEEEFYYHSVRKIFSSECKRCSAIKRQKYDKDYPAYRWATNTVYQHRKKGFEILMSVEEIEKLYNESITEPCEICGTMMERGNPLENSPTLDVKIPMKRVICKDNVWIICHFCNRAKGRKTMEEFREYINLLAYKFKEFDKNT